MERYQLLKKKPQIVCLSEKVNGHRIFLYRDDPEDFGFGGNKVRFYEYLIPEILKERPQVLVTSGSMYSNHIRVTAQVACQLQLPCVLFLTEDRLPDRLTGNLEIARACGAKLQCVGHFAALLKIQEAVQRLKEEGKTVFLVENGGHTPGAVRAYANVINETLNFLEQRRVHPATIYLPCASGTTQAGILCGAAKRSLPPVVSFAVSNTPVRAAGGISRLIASASKYLAKDFVPDGITVEDCGKNNYGRPDNTLLELRESVYRGDGILLDPTYNINAFYGMLGQLKQMPGKEDVLYINTGGYLELDPLENGKKA